MEVERTTMKELILEKFGHPDDYLDIQLVLDGRQESCDFHPAEVSGATGLGTLFSLMSAEVEE